MPNLYFIRSNGEKRLVRENINPDIAIAYINEYVAQLNPNYEIYYIRSWGDLDKNGITYDVGSHTEFFKLVDEN
jgi:hypothetical protein